MRNCFCKRRTHTTIAPDFEGYISRSEVREALLEERRLRHNAAESQHGEATLRAREAEETEGAETEFSKNAMG